MPLIAGGRVIGLAELSDYAPRDFSHELELIRGLGQVAAHDLQNASLFEQAERRSRVLDDLADLALLSSRTRDLDSLLGRIAERLLQALDAANCDVFRVCDEGLRCVASYDRSGLDEQQVGRLLDLEAYPALVGAINRRQVLIITGPDDPQLSDEEKRTYRDYGFASEISVPLVVNDELYGIIDIYDTRERDYAEYLPFLRSAAQSLAGAFENSRLVEQLSRRTAELREIVDLGAMISQARNLEEVLGVVAGRLEACDHAVVELEAEVLGAEPGRVDGDDRRAGAAGEELVQQPAARLLPERKVAAQAGDVADALHPVAVRLKVDVTEDAGLDALRAQLVENRDEGGLVAVPGGGASDQRDADRRRLRLEQRERQAVPAAHEIGRAHV